MFMGGRFGSYADAKRKDEQKYGEYRTKRVIMECYDAMERP